MISLRQPPNFYAGNDFNRLAERRQDDAWISGVLERGEAYLLPFWRERSLIVGGSDTPSIAFLPHQALPVTHQELVFLGEFRGRYCFAVHLDAATAPALNELGEFHDLRTIGGQMDRHEAGLLGYARAMVVWRDRHRFCGRCGSPTHSTHAGHILKCSNERCGLAHFPRLDPVVIMLVTDGERVLLGRQATWPPGRYSALAGFVEWAESVEEAVAREVFEEAGIVVNAVEYHSSQPWPFPSSLMLGFIAHAATTDIQLTDQELEDARWFSRADLAGGAVILPPPQAIAYRLIEHWYDRDSEQPLREAAAAHIRDFAAR